MEAPLEVSMTVNGQAVHAWLPASTTLMEALRDEFGRTDVKYGCGEGVCGTCTVLLDGEPINACLMFAVQANGTDVRTLAGMAAEDGSLHELQHCFLQKGASQCGFCTPGMVLTALAYAESGGSADRTEIRHALSGNLCRCTGYVKIVDAVEEYMTGSAARAESDT